MTNLTTTIDALGTLQVEIAKLEARAKMLKDMLIEAGPGSYEGEKFKVTVTQASTREQLDMKAVRAKLSPQFLTAHTAIVRISPSVRVSARMDAVADTVTLRVA